MPESSLEMSTWVSGCNVPVADTCTVRSATVAGAVVYSIRDGAAAFLVLLSNLNSKINQRGNNADGRDYLPDGGKHFPIHNVDVAGLTRIR